MNRLKKGDKVIVISGQHKGETGTITKVDLVKAKVYLDSITYVKHAKQTATQEAGIKRIPRPIHESNVALLEPESNKAAKIRFMVDADGNKQRIFKVNNQPV